MHLLGGLEVDSDVRHRSRHEPGNVCHRRRSGRAAPWSPPAREQPAARTPDRNGGEFLLGSQGGHQTKRRDRIGRRFTCSDPGNVAAATTPDGARAGVGYPEEQHGAAAPAREEKLGAAAAAREGSRF
jgi:hypothetical protein